MSVLSWTRMCCSILVPNLFSTHSVICEFQKKDYLNHDQFTYTDVSFYRIRGDQQHFVRRDELRVCDFPYICTSFEMGSLVNSRMWQYLFLSGCMGDLHSFASRHRCWQGKVRSIRTGNTRATGGWWDEQEDGVCADPRLRMGAANPR